MLSLPVPVIDNPDWLQAYVRKMIRRFARGEGGDKRAVGNQTLAMFALVCKKLNKFIQPRLDRRFYTDRPHHPRVVLDDITLMKTYRRDVIKEMLSAIKRLAPNVTSEWVEMRGGISALQVVVKTGYVLHGFVRVVHVTPAVISVHVYSNSVSRTNCKRELEFLVYLTFDTRGWYVVLDNIHEKRIHIRDFHEVLRQRITAAFKRGDFPLA
jgi:hypothetical protein